ncbi:hypothetical protein D3OALGB2SA_1017 [Olavius algarvensis associated proteobacterium Delta 3]|nr:hypothetical protein D3OALGB2SA_1017 [Olavius algarvensis associated proteobacterium Delta 3]
MVGPLTDLAGLPVDPFSRLMGQDHYNRRSDKRIKTLLLKLKPVIPGPG